MIPLWDWGNYKWKVKSENPKTAINRKYLGIIETDIYDMVAESLMHKQGRIFGAAILDPCGKLIIATGNSIFRNGNALMHAEITAMTKAQELYPDDIVGLEDHILISTHEPCPLCLSGAFWCGIKEIYYLFSYEETEKDFDMPGDIKMMRGFFDRSHADHSNGLIKMEKLFDGDNIKKKYKELYDKYFINGVPREE